MRLYNLTQYTGQKASEDRTMTIQTFSVRPKVLLNLAVALIPAILVSAIAWIFLGLYGVLVGAVAGGVVFWLLTARTTDSRNIPQYKALIDSRQAKAEVGRFFVGANKIDPLLSVDGVLVPGSTPVGQKEREVIPVFEDRSAEFDSLFKRR